MHNGIINNSANNKSHFVGYFLFIQACVSWKAGPNLFLLSFVQL